MEQGHLRFLSALRAALQNEKADLHDLSREEWAQLLHMAQAHKVLPLILEAVHACPSFTGDGELAQFKRLARNQVVTQALRTEEFRALNGKLRAAGITPLVVKGLVCRQLYPQPDHRPSSDEDVLIMDAQFGQCRAVMEEFGMVCAGEEDSGAHEISFRKAGSPLYIELHRHLFPPESAAYGDLNRFFADVFDRVAEVEVQGIRVLTLEPTDHLFYLICHAFKHFLHSGFGIRQVCDIVLFARRHAGEIRWQQVMADCAAIRADIFAGAIFRIGDKHLGIDCPDAWPYTDIDEDPMLEDLLSGGVYGDATLSRRHSSSITLNAVAAQKQGRKGKNAMLSSAFPSADKLSGKYPYLKEKPWLLPAAWGQRLWRYARETRKTGNNSAGEALKIGADRVELMRRYGIIR